MKRIVLPVGIASVLVIVALAIAQTGGPDKPKDMDDQIKGLKNEVDSLQSRLANLEKQVSELTKLLRVYPAPIPQLAPGVRGLPEGSKPFEFNGLTFYCVPVREKAATPKSPDR
jgi:hypothetical protein